MASYNNRQSIQVAGNGNVVGSHNVVNSRREEHHHHHRHTSNSGRNGDDAVGIGLGILAVVVTICWFFVKHSGEVYFYLKLGVLISAVPFLAVIAFGVFQNSLNDKQVIAAIFGAFISIFAFVLIMYGQASLDPQLVQFSQQAQNAFAFWKGLKVYEQHLVIGCLVGAVCLGTAVLFSLLMGGFVLWHFLLEADTEDSLVLRALNPFRPSRGGIVAAMLLLAAWAFESGFVFEVVVPASTR